VKFTVTSHGRFALNRFPLDQVRFDADYDDDDLDLRQIEAKFAGGTATGKARQLFDGVQAKLGLIPNLFRVFGNSPAALEGYLSFSGALASGVLNAKVREQIALAVAEMNYCGYCLSAHTYIGGKVGLSESEITAARKVEVGGQK